MMNDDDCVDYDDNDVKVEVSDSDDEDETDLDQCIFDYLLSISMRIFFFYVFTPIMYHI